MSSNDLAPRFGHAIVLGAGMGGLVAARALAEHFHDVTVVERDHLPEAPAARPGVPQGRHLHVLLPGGLRALGRLFPAYAPGLEAAGAVPIRVTADMAWLNPAAWMPRAEGRHVVLSASRELIEAYTRARLAESANVSIVDGRRVCGLALSGDGRSVTGVVIRHTGDDDDADPVTLRADLVVDATGRRTRMADWLGRAGFGRPPETVIDAGLAYASRVYRRTPSDADWTAAFVQARPPETSRVGVMFAVEDDRWLVTLQGSGGDHPPTDDEGFLAFARSLRSPIIHDVLRDAEPLTPVVAFANTANRRRHYERMPRWPERLVVMADSACAFNPTYGQGMTVAAQTALVLRDRLAEHGLGHHTLDGFARPMQRAVARCGRAAWTIATGEDLRLSTTTGATANALVRRQHRYFDRVMTAATRDQVVLDAVTDVLFLLRRPESLFRPRIVARVLRHSRVSGPGSAPSGAEPGPRTATRV